MKTNFGAWFPEPFPAYGFATVEQFDAFKKKLPDLVKAVDKYGPDSLQAVAVAGKMPFRLDCNVGKFNVPYLGGAPPERQVSLTRAFAETFPLYLKERGLYEQNDFRAAVKEWDNLKIKDFMCRFEFYGIATGSQGLALHFYILQAEIMGRHDAELIGRHDGDFKSYNLLVEGLSHHWLQHLKLDSGIISHMDIAAAKGDSWPVGISEAKRFCKLRGLEPLELDGLLRDGVITFSQVVAALDSVQEAVPAGSEAGTGDTCTESRKLAKFLAVGLEGNFSGLESMKPFRIWGKVYSDQTGLKAPKDTQKAIIPGINWTFVDFQRYFRREKQDFIQLVTG